MLLLPQSVLESDRICFDLGSTQYRSITDKFVWLVINFSNHRKSNFLILVFD